MPRDSTRRTLVVTISILIFAIGAPYALGGGAVFRQMRARIRAFMEPPTPAQIQRAVAAEARQAAIDSIVRADTTHAPRADPPASLGFIAKLIAATLGGVIILVVASTRWGAPASDARDRR